MTDPSPTPHEPPLVRRTERCGWSNAYAVVVGCGEGLASKPLVTGSGVLLVRPVRNRRGSGLICPGKQDPRLGDEVRLEVGRPCPRRRRPGNSPGPHRRNRHYRRSPRSGPRTLAAPPGRSVLACRNSRCCASCVGRHQGNHRNATHRKSTSWCWSPTLPTPSAARWVKGSPSLSLAGASAPVIATWAERTGGSSTKPSIDAPSCPAPGSCPPRQPPVREATVGRLDRWLHDIAKERPVAGPRTQPPSALRSAAALRALQLRARRRRREFGPALDLRSDHLDSNRRPLVPSLGAGVQAVRRRL
jgi:hypothetical protein